MLALKLSLINKQKNAFKFISYPKYILLMYQSNYVTNKLVNIVYALKWMQENTFNKSVTVLIRVEWKKEFWEIL